MGNCLTPFKLGSAFVGYIFKGGLKMKKNSNRSHFNKEINFSRWERISGMNARYTTEKKTQINQAKTMGVLQKIKEIAHPEHRVQNKGD